MGWTSRPPGHLSLAEAAARTGYTTERLRQLAHEGRIDSKRVPAGNRQRIWLPEHAVDSLRPSGRPPGGPPSVTRTVKPHNAGSEPQAAMFERDRWRAEALRLRDVGLRMAAALDAMSEATQHHAAAANHLRAALTDLEQAFERAREAQSMQNDALRQFMIPGDVTEN